MPHVKNRKNPFPPFLSTPKSPSPTCCEFAAVLPPRPLTVIGAIGDMLAWDGTAMLDAS